jgi:NAD(P)-dependent dehydrogenase (short-subunit alcohol dehydrogenase family)
VNLCKQAAIESAAEGVRVNVVAPSACDTGLFVRTAERTGDAAAVMRQVAGRLPMQRLGTAADVCAAVLYLASDDAAYVSGTVLAVDGGLAARRQ